MKEKQFKNLDECLGYVKALEDMGVSIPDWLKKQKEQLESGKKTKPHTQGHIVDANSGTPIYDTLKANAPFQPIDPNKLKCIEDTVTQLLDEGPNAKEPCLLLGRIQCGKTDTFENIIGLAFDKGIDIAIIFTKGTNPLTEQTIKRLERDYRFFKKSDDLTQKATIYIHDIMKIHRNGLAQATVNKSKTVIVCKKESRNLGHLVELFTNKCQFLRNKKVLIVDDEADFASRNYRDTKTKVNLTASALELAKIAQQIDDFRNIPNYCRYLQVTATPYCLYLQPQGYLNLVNGIAMPFRPRFTAIVPTHDKYIGGKQYFEDSQNPQSMYSLLYQRVSPECLKVLGKVDRRYINNQTPSPKLFDMMRALTSYLMATAIRRIQERTNNRNYQSSALIHVEVSTRQHNWHKQIIERLLDDIKKYYTPKNGPFDLLTGVLQQICYHDLEKSIQLGNASKMINTTIPTVEEVQTELKEMFANNEVRVQIVNSNNDVKNLLDQDTGELRLDAAANIFIGGNILDRGITIKNMLCFFYGRNPNNFQQDTVLQHARMYGARDKEDMAVTRFHTTDRIHKILIRMNELDNQLREWFLSGKNDAVNNAVFVGYDSNIKPCAPQKIKASNALSLKPLKRVLPIGFWTGSATSISKIISGIDSSIINSPGYKKQDQNGFFEIEKDLVVAILKQIKSTYIYDKKYCNTEYERDMDELLCAVEYCAEQSQGKLYGLHRTNRSLKRIRDNGGFVDAPDDGRSDLEPAKAIAKDRPVIMFIREEGKKQDQKGKNVGWNNTPFYWPLLLTQQNLSPAMYTIEQS